MPPKNFDDKEKWCPRCSTRKLLKDFSSNKSTPSGLSAYCLECCKQISKEGFHKCDRAARDARNFSRNLRRYSLTPEAYKEMYDKQKGKCAITSCPRSISAIDHDHETQTVRGLLCRQCNSALGLMMENPQILRDAADYIENFEEN